MYEYATTSTHPNIKSPFHKLEWQASLLIRQTDPDLGIHEQAVVQIDNSLLGAIGPAVDFQVLLASSPLQAVQAEQKAILCLDYMLFCFVSPELTELNEVGRIAHGGGNG